MTRAARIIEELTAQVTLSKAQIQERVNRALWRGTLDNTHVPTSKLPSRALLENAEVKEGIYYCLPLPNGTWQLYAHVFSDFGDDPNTTHGDVWQTFVAHLLSLKWEPHTTLDADDLERKINLLAYGVPRGRVSLGNGTLRGKVIVNHGSDLPSSISPSTVERAFGIQGRADWQTDEHERRDPDDTLELRDILAGRYVNPENPGRFPSLKSLAPAGAVQSPAKRQASGIKQPAPTASATKAPAKPAPVAKKPVRPAVRR